MAVHTCCHCRNEAYSHWLKTSPRGTFLFPAAEREGQTSNKESYNTWFQKKAEEIEDRFSG